jgi:hypothetical protein
MTSLIYQPLSTSSPDVGQKRFLWEYGQKVYSQNGEDGILYYLLSCLSRRTQIAVEMGSGDGLECNTGFFVRHHGYTSYFIDGSAYWIQKGKEAYRSFRINGTPVFINAWMTKETILELLDAHAIPKDIDVLSVDIDGMDYWILKEIMDAKRLKPAIIVVEYQDILGPERAWTVPYQSQFNHTDYDCLNGPNYCGASLKAFMHLLGDTYAFVGCEEKGFNGFFIRRDAELKKEIPEMTDIRPCFEIEKVKFGMEHRFKRTAHLEWVDVSKEAP